MISLAQMLSERRRLKPLALDGIEGTVEALRAGTYPHAKTLALVTKPQPAPLVEIFLQFVRSAEGQRILASSGHLVTGANARPGM
jgi:phosphate transport system substrate-binding protein